ncbi:enterobactin exporter EntS [Sporomusa ovata DSM 2662]|nr:MFS transporter [Sporomusa ovata]EQB28919.1 major facilitator superfamily MFS_1 [Sporomusa ovata DSM 2662]
MKKGDALFFQNPVFVFADFRRIYLAKLVSNIGERFFLIAVSWWVLHSPVENSNSLLGFIMGAATVARIVFGPVMGVYADRYNKKQCMLVAAIIPMFIVAGLILVFPWVEQHLLSLWVFHFCIASFLPLMMAASTSSLPLVVHKDDIAKAVAMDGGILFIGQAVGSTAAGAFIMLAGVIGAFYVNAAAYGIAILCLLRIKSNLHVEQAKPETQHSMWKDIKEGFHYFAQNTLVLRLVAIFCVANFFMSPIMIAIPILTIEVFNGTAFDMSLLELSLALGAVFMSGILGSWQREFSLSRILPFTMLLNSGVLLAISQSREFYFICIALFLMGSSISVTNAVVMAKMQKIIPDAIKGRIFSLGMMGALLVAPVALALTGILSDSLGIKNVIFINGVAFIIVGMAAYFLFKNEINFTESRDGNNL